MELPEFQVITQDKTSTPPWAKYMKDGEFISYGPTFPAKQFFHLFDEYVMPCDKTGDIRYYVYDPTKHGYPADRKYPVLMWLHGASNSLDGVKCIMCCGAEQFATPKYQDAMGGAYIIVPLANEERTVTGEIKYAWNTWDEADTTSIYSKVVKQIYDKVCLDNIDTIGKKFIMGASSGGYMTWQMLDDYPEYFQGAIPISAVYEVNDDLLDKLKNTNVQIIVAHGRRDEMASFEELILPMEKKLNEYDNVTCYFPEWVKNGDGGISSICYGFEMGQHCMINQIQANLMFDDGTPMCDEFQDGITGWIKRVAENS